jgi:hypothetical protein
MIYLLLLPICLYRHSRAKILVDLVNETGKREQLPENDVLTFPQFAAKTFNIS